MTRTELALLKEHTLEGSDRAKSLTLNHIIDVQETVNSQHRDYVMLVSICKDAVRSYIFHKSLMRSCAKG